LLIGVGDYPAFMPHSEDHTGVPNLGTQFIKGYEVREIAEFVSCSDLGEPSADCPT
jgi:hypothetical protein